MRDSSEAELQALDSVCERLAGFGADLNAEWVDGYLTALHAGPRAIPPERWRPAMLGDSFERAFADPADEAQAMAALQARCDALASQLDPQALLDEPDSARLAPLMLTYEGDDVPPVGALWAEGFEAARRDFADEWSLPPALDEDERRWFEGALGRIRALALEAPALDTYLAATWPDKTPTRDELIDEACFAVQDLRTFWVDHAPRPATRRVPAAPGRNDPCPCGSGRKYKKCHGAAA